MRASAGSIVVAAIAAAMVAVVPVAADEPAPTPWLGISYQPLPGGGVEVTEVHPNTPAAAAGLRPHDVVLAANGQPIYELGQQIRRASIGRRFPLVVSREGRRLLVTPRLTARPTPDELVHALLVGHDLPALTAVDALGVTVRRDSWRGRPMVAVVFDARCEACASALPGLADELARGGVAERATVRALVLADSQTEFEALRARVPLAIPAWRVERREGAALLGALEGRADGAVLVLDADTRIRYAAALSSGALAHDGACQVAAGLLAR